METIYFKIHNMFLLNKIFCYDVCLINKTTVSLGGAAWGMMGGRVMTCSKRPRVKSNPGACAGCVYMVVASKTDT